MNMQAKTTVNQVNFSRHIKAIKEKHVSVTLSDVAQLVRF